MEDLSLLREAYRAVFNPSSGMVFKDRVVVARTIVGENKRGLDFITFLER